MHNKSQGHEQKTMKIIKIVTIIALFGLFLIPDSAKAQTRTKISNGVYLVNYANTWTIEDDNTQQCITLSIDKREDRSGRPVYDILCGNKYTKGVAKTALKRGITSALSAAGAALGGPGGAKLGAIISTYVNSIASNIYDDVCDYYKDK